MTTEKQAPRRRMSKVEYTQYLLRMLDKWQREGATAEEAVERLSLKQYDFLIGEKVNLDNLLLTPEQLKVVQAITRAPRPTFPDGYTKRYPETKQALYTSLVEHLTSQGATVHEREKQNFRDLDFTLAGTEYKIVLSNPRPKK